MFNVVYLPTGLPVAHSLTLEQALALALQYNTDFGYHYGIENGNG